MQLVQLNLPHTHVEREVILRPIIIDPALEAGPPVSRVGGEQRWNISVRQPEVVAPSTVRGGGYPLDAVRTHDSLDRLAVEIRHLA